METKYKKVGTTKLGATKVFFLILSFQCCFHRDATSRVKVCNLTARQGRPTVTGFHNESNDVACKENWQSKREERGFKNIWSS